MGMSVGPQRPLLPGLTSTAVVELQATQVSDMQAIAWRQAREAQRLAVESAACRLSDCADWVSAGRPAWSGSPWDSPHSCPISTCLPKAPLPWWEGSTPKRCGLLGSTALLSLTREHSTAHLLLLGWHGLLCRIWLHSIPHVYACERIAVIPS